MAKGTSSARRFVTGSVVNIAIIAGVVLAAGYAAKKFNLGGQIVKNIEGAGNIAGQGLIAPLSGLVQGFNLGGQGLATQLGSAQEALFHQFALTQDSFNKFFHPDWYNSDGSYSTKNPNYQGNKPNNNQLPQISSNGFNDPNTPALDNGAKGVNSQESRITYRNPLVNGDNNTGSNLIITSKLSNPITGSSGGKISGTVQTVPLGALIQASPGSTPKPLNLGLINLINSGTPVYSGTISTTVGGTRTIVGSQRVFDRLAQNLGIR